MTSAELLKDPYPLFRRLRAEAPVSRLEPQGHWLIARHADVLTVLKDAETFSSAGNYSKLPSPDGPHARDQTEKSEFILETRSLLGEDPPAHPRLRSLIRGAFSPPRMQSLESRVRHVVRSRLHRLTAEFDFVRDVSGPLPMEVLALLLGVDPAMAPEFQSWANLLVTYGSDDCRLGEPEARALAAEMYDYFAREIRTRKSGPPDGLLAFLSHEASEDEKKLLPREIIAFARLLLVAGTETTTHLLSNTALALLEQPGLWRQVQSDRSLVHELIEESLRYDGPVPSLIRRATIDAQIGGVAIKKGEFVLPLLASANHDEAVFPEPERFKLDRPARQHLSFGAGSHYCMGTMLARIQAQAVFEELFITFDEIRRENREPIERVESFFVRGPKELKISAVRR